MTDGTVRSENAPAHTVDPAGVAAASERAATRRPLADHEAPYTVALGALIRSHRLAADLTVAQAADLAELSERHWRRLETGERRTRASTLARIAAAIGADVDTLIAAAGPAIATESAYVDRVTRRRNRRTRRRRWVLEAKERDAARRAAAVDDMDADIESAAETLSRSVSLLARIDTMTLAEIARLERELGIR